MRILVIILFLFNFVQAQVIDQYGSIVTSNALDTTLTIDDDLDSTVIKNLINSGFKNISISSTIRSGEIEDKEILFPAISTLTNITGVEISILNNDLCRGFGFHIHPYEKEILFKDRYTSIYKLGNELVTFGIYEKDGNNVWQIIATDVKVSTTDDVLDQLYIRGDVIKVQGRGSYKVTSIPNSLWNGGVDDTTFVIKVNDKAPWGYNGFKASEDLSNQTYWVRGGTPDGFSVIANSDLAPDGTKTADRFVYANSSPLRGKANYAIVAGREYTVSMYIKVPPAASNNDMEVRVELNQYSSGRVTITPNTTDKRWFRYSATLTADADNVNPDIDIDFGTANTDIGDTLILWGLQFEEGTESSDYKRTETLQTTEGVVYLHYIPEYGTVRVDQLYNKGLEDYELIQRSLDYCNSVKNVSTVLLEQDRILTDSITVPIHVTLQGLNTANAVGGTWEKMKTIVTLDLQDSTKTAITFVGEGSDQLTGNGIKNLAFVPISKGNALLNTGNVIRGTIENIDMASWEDNERYFNYGVILGAGSLHNVIKDCSFLHLNRSGVYSRSSAIMEINNVRVTEAVHGIEVTAAALYINGMWIEDMDSSALVFSGNLCHINRLYTEDVPQDTTVASNTLFIKKCSVFSVTNSDLQGGQLVADTFQTYIYLDSVRVAEIANNQIQASRRNLVTTSQTGYVKWDNNVESNNSDEKIIEGIFTNVYNPDRLIVISSTGQNSFMDSDNWIPHIKSNNIKFKPYTATEASALTPTEAMFIYVNSTNGTFTSIGWWGYDGTNWIQF